MPETSVVMVMNTDGLKLMVPSLRFDPLPIALIGQHPPLMLATFWKVPYHLHKMNLMRPQPCFFTNFNCPLISTHFPQLLPRGNGQGK
jgi:hypothetical protein